MVVRGARMRRRWCRQLQGRSSFSGKLWLARPFAALSPLPAARSLRWRAAAGRRSYEGWGKVQRSQCNRQVRCLVEAQIGDQWLSFGCDMFCL
uniref:Uncharacterized protein n=1 Tax=Setaria italica TaxID=4555 RepID=K3ZGJ9_SETIT